jgi:YVTN family beta-propeller protein
MDRALASRVILVLNGRGGAISVVDTATSRVRATITGAGARPWGLALSPGRVVRKIATCRGPWGVVLR